MEYPGAAVPGSLHHPPDRGGRGQRGRGGEGKASHWLHTPGLMQRSHVERKDFGVLTIIISVFKVTHGDQIFINCTENYEVLKLLQIQREWKRYGHYI